MDSREDAVAPSEAADVAVIGAGAAGLLTAIFARRLAPGARVLLLEGQKRPGAKILVSGGGRCNVSNREVRPADFHGERRAIARVLDRFPVLETVAFFSAIGVELKHEPEFGKLFPVTDSAKTVLGALLGECERLGVELRCGVRVVGVEKGARFRLSAVDGSIIEARRLVLATGGASLPRSGSDGTGYTLARSLGHSVTATAPALVPLVLDPNFLRELAGVAFPAVLEVWQSGRKSAEVRGPLLITHFGLSGPAALDLSRHWTVTGDPRPEIRLGFFPGERPEQVEARWLEQARAPGRPLVSSLVAHLPERLARLLLLRAGLSAAMPLAALDRDRRRSLLALLTAFTLPVTGTRGWNEAEVTAGGVPLAELHARTLESRVCPGLYLVGEILDVDGRLGGFNFQWAWASGRVAGSAVVSQ